MDSQDSHGRITIRLIFIAVRIAYFTVRCAVLFPLREGYPYSMTPARGRRAEAISGRRTHTILMRNRAAAAALPLGTKANSFVAASLLRPGTCRLNENSQTFTTGQDRVLQDIFF